MPYKILEINDIHSRKFLMNLILACIRRRHFRGLLCMELIGELQIRHRVCIVVHFHTRCNAPRPPKWWLRGWEIYVMINEFICAQGVYRSDFYFVCDFYFCLPELVPLFMAIIVLPAFIPEKMDVSFTSNKKVIEVAQVV